MYQSLVDGTSNVFTDCQASLWSLYIFLITLFPSIRISSSALSWLIILATLSALRFPLPPPAEQHENNNKQVSNFRSDITSKRLIVLLNINNMLKLEFCARLHENTMSYLKSAVTNIIYLLKTCK